MPSFDVISEVNMHEVTNAVDQANREISNRFDFKGTNAEIKLNKDIITLSAPNEFQIKQMSDIIMTKMSKRSIDIKSLDIRPIQNTLNQSTQEIKIKQGIEQDIAKQISKLIKDSKLKVQASIQGDKVRITGKKKDDLQEAIAWLRKQEIPLPLQYDNFRD